MYICMCVQVFVTHAITCFQPLVSANTGTIREIEGQYVINRDRHDGCCISVSGVVYSLKMLVMYQELISGLCM